MTTLQLVTVNCQAQHRLLPMKAWLRKTHPHITKVRSPLSKPIPVVPTWDCQIPGVQLHVVCAQYDFVEIEGP